MTNYDEFIQNGKKMVLYSFSTRHLKKKDKVRFYYALKGRDGKTGIVKKCSLVHLGKGVLLVPYAYDEDVLQFLKVWNSDYTRRKVIADDDNFVKGLP